MKVKVLYGILIIDVLTILFIFTVDIIPSNIIRIIIGLPFLLFFPGYTLVVSLFPGKTGLDSIEHIALSFGTSIIIVGLIGLFLNFSPWGIKSQPVLYIVSAFIIVMSTIALIRQTRQRQEKKSIGKSKINLTEDAASPFGKRLTIILIVCILGALGVLYYTFTTHKGGEKFTEFYILGLNGKAQDYPRVFYVTNNQVVRVRYVNAFDNVTNSGKVTLGIVNHEQQEVSYSIVIRIDGEQVNISYAGQNNSQIQQIELQDKEKWEQEIEFTPQHVGDNQKVEFSLNKNGNSFQETSLVLWIDVKEAK